MPIWGGREITWRQVLPPVLAAAAVACLAYALHGCLRGNGSEIVRRRERLEFYLQQLSMSDVATRAEAARQLGEHGDPTAIEALRPLLGESDPRIVGAACAALGNLGDKESTEASVKLLSHQNAAVTAGAAEGLGALGSKEAVEPLVQLLGTRDAGTRLAVIVALGRIGESSAAVALKRLKPNPCLGLDPQPAGGERPRFEQALAEALEKLGAAE